jgi:hypothetical protein
MGLKRKRSSDYTYSPSSSSAFSVSSGGSSSPSPNPLQCHMAVPETGVQMELGFSVSKPFSYLGDSSGRTRKRWRNRPNEEAVYGKQLGAVTILLMTRDPRAHHPEAF